MLKAHYILEGSHHEEIKPGATIVDFRGKAWTYLHISKLPTTASGGKIYCDSGLTRMELYPNVFGCRLVEVKDAKD